MPDFVHLHLRSHYSLLEGAIHLEDAVTRVKAYGMKALAITDRGQMCSAVDFYKQAKKAGVKAILGIDQAIAEGSRFDRPPPNAPQHHQLVLLARNPTGYSNLRQLSTRAWTEGLHDVPRADRELLKLHAEGLIALSGGTDGEIARMLSTGRRDQAVKSAKFFKDLFGPDGFYLEILATHTKKQIDLNRELRALGRELDIPLVATNDCRYLERRDARAHEVLECIRQGYTLDSRQRPQAETDQYYLKRPDEMWEVLGAEYADALENTCKIAEMCAADPCLRKPDLPAYQVPSEFTTDTYLAHRSREGLERRFQEITEKGLEYDREVYVDRLELEVTCIQKMGFPGYFLIVQDFINWAKEHGIPVGPGRGSGAGSLVAWALRITDLDPIPYGLLFERFLNPERVSMPDFDIDFCMNRRGEVIEYVTHKYGKNNVGQIATYGGLKAKGVIKDVGRVLGLSFAETDRLSKLVPEVLGITLEDAVKQEPRLKAAAEEDNKIKDLLEVAQSLEGLHRNFGMHAAGVVIGNQPLWGYCPLFTGANGELVTQFAKDEVEEVGLVKFDFLGLKTLTVIETAVQLINRNRKRTEQLDVNKLPFTDKAVYDLISKGDTEGVFQLESSGFQEMMKKLKPDVFEDIVAAVALYRPGPMGSGMHLDFIARKHGKQKITYPHACLEGILKDTYGVIVYQEQVMQIAQVMAGYTLGGADILRRAMGKKKAEEMAKQRQIFVEGSLKNGVDGKTAGEVFDLMETFAQYGFNKSHSAAYAVLTYQTGWLKAHHPVEFWASMLTNDRENADKVAKGIRHARNSGIEVMPPDVNRSGVDFDAEGGKILFGMAGVKGVGQTAVEAILEARKEGRFKSLFDFCERVDMKRVNKKTLEALIKTGAFDFCGHPRARLMEAIDKALQRAQAAQAQQDQADFFGMLALPGGATAADETLTEDVLAIHEWSEKDLLAAEKEVLGFYVSGHPLDRFAEIIRKSGAIPIDALERRENFEKVTIAGLISSVRIRPFKNGNGRMGIVLIEDATGSIEVVAMGEELDRNIDALVVDEPMLLRGTLRLDRDDEGNTKVSMRLGGGRRGETPDPNEVLVDRLSAVREKRSSGIAVIAAAHDLTHDRLETLRRTLAEPRYAGTCAAWLEVKTANQCVVKLKLPTTLTPSDALDDAVRRALGGAADVRMT